MVILCRSDQKDMGATVAVAVTEVAWFRIDVLAKINIFRLRTSILIECFS